MIDIIFKSNLTNVPNSFMGDVLMFRGVNQRWHTTKPY